MVKFGERVKQLRLSAGMTQEQLAERIWVSKAAISNYELSERNPSPETIIKNRRSFRRIHRLSARHRGQKELYH